MDEKDLIPIIREEEIKKAYARLAESVLDEGQVPPKPFLILREMHYPIKFVVGSVLGVFIGVMSLVIIFFLFVHIMHMEF